MKNIIGLIIGLLILGGILYFLKTSNPEVNNTLNSTGVKFAVDQEDIGRIKISNKSGRVQEFLRDGDRWVLDSKYLTSVHSMSYLLNTMSKMDMIYIPYKSHTENILKDMDKIGIHVEIYDRQNKKIKGYVIGANSLQSDATYFLLDGDTQPYAMNIKGFNGTIRNRFNHLNEDWRDKTLFDEKAEDIDSVTVRYPKLPSASFVLVNDNGVYDLRPESNLTPRINSKLNEAKVDAFLHSFQNVGAEGFDNRNEKKDSIMNLTQFVEFDIVRKDGREINLKMIPFRDIIDPDVNTKDFKELEKTERYFVTNSDTGDFLVIQQRLFKDLLRPYDYFFK